MGPGSQQVGGGVEAGSRTCWLVCRKWCSPAHWFLILFHSPQELHVVGEIRKRRRWSGEKNSSGGGGWLLFPSAAKSVSCQWLWGDRGLLGGMKMTEGHGCVSSLGAENSKVKGLVHLSSAIFAGCVTFISYFHLSETQLFHPPKGGWMHEMT